MWLVLQIAISQLNSICKTELHILIQVGRRNKEGECKLKDHKKKEKETNILFFHAKDAKGNIDILLTFCL